MGKMKDYLFDQVSRLPDETQDALLGGAPMYHGTAGWKLKEGEILSADNAPFRNYESRTAEDWGDPDQNYKLDADKYDDRVFATTNLQHAQFWAEKARAAGPLPERDETTTVYEVEPYGDEPLYIDESNPYISSSVSGKQLRVRGEVMNKSHEDWPDGPVGPRDRTVREELEESSF